MSNDTQIQDTAQKRATLSGPVTLYLDGKSVEVHRVDAAGWQANGWGEDPETVSPPPTEPETVKVKKGNKVEEIPADQVEARKADGWTVVED